MVIDPDSSTDANLMIGLVIPFTLDHFSLVIGYLPFSNVCLIFWKFKIRFSLKKVITKDHSSKMKSETLKLKINKGKNFHE